MRIRKARRVQQTPSARGFCTLGKFNLQITDDVMVCDCTVVKAPDGRVFLYGPGTGTSTLSVSPVARHSIVEMALAALGMNANDAAAV